MGSHRGIARCAPCVVVVVAALWRAPVPFACPDYRQFAPQTYPPATICQRPTKKILFRISNLQTIFALRYDFACNSFLQMLILHHEHDTVQQGCSGVPLRRQKRKACVRFGAASAARPAVQNRLKNTGPWESCGVFWQGSAVAASCVILCSMLK